MGQVPGRQWLRRKRQGQARAHPVALAKKASADVIKVLVVAGADIGARDDEEKTPLHKVAKNNPSAVRVLIKSGTKVNKLNKDQTWEFSVTPLFYAAKCSYRDATIALCAAGADPRLGDLSPLDADCVKENMKTLIREQFPVRSSSLTC